MRARRCCTGSWTRSGRYVLTIRAVRISHRVCGTTWRSSLRSSRLPEEVQIRYREPTAGIGPNPPTASTCAQAGGEMRKGKMPNREVTPSSGNVFADLKLPHADDLLAKAELAAKIIAEIQRRRLTQSQGAAILGIDQPKISALKQGKLSGFSIERLIRLLLALGRDVEITVKTRSKRRVRATSRCLNRYRRLTRPAIQGEGMGHRSIRVVSERG
jgi:predicted XRE-type DNA-binding protein